MFNAVGPIVDVLRPNPGGKPHMNVRGMFGIGDCIFQRAILRELMVTHQVCLDSYYVDMFWDLIEQGLKVNIIKDRGRIADGQNRSQKSGKLGIPPILKRQIATSEKRLTYDRKSIHQHGSILAAMYASVGLRMSDSPDFSIPVRPEWKARWLSVLANQCARRKIKLPSKPIAIYRPIMANTQWSAPARSPDPYTYARLFTPISDKFFWVSIADTRERSGHTEWVVGTHQRVDLDLERGELDFTTLCGLFASARMIYSNPGFVPVLGQATGVPTIVVYGANESFRTTNSVGKHLAKTLPIDLDKPCECHAQSCTCGKTITVAPARRKVLKFTEAVLSGLPDVLIFGTMYSDTPERAELTQLWKEVHSEINGDSDLLLVDSASPVLPSLAEDDQQFKLFKFRDNVGHLSRNGPNGAKSSGKDGWGRALSKGLELATSWGYDYAVHIEGDSLFKHPVRPIIERMQKEELSFVSVPVKGTKSTETNWVETGLMFFDMKWVKESRFIERYNWEKRTQTPTPERVIHTIVNESKAKWKLESWGALRGDKQQINESNIAQLDWVSHIRDKSGLDDMKLYRKFGRRALEDAKSPDPVAPGVVELVAAMTAPAPAPATAVVKINLGCGTNRLDGWQNHDRDIDITKRLPFQDAFANFVFAEHVVEHVSLHQAINFFKQCFRVLKPGGVLRITVPSISQIFEQGADPEYLEFVHSRGWAPTKDLRGVMHAILFCHGHQMAWTGELLRLCLYYAGFSDTVVTVPGKSARPELVGVEGHGKVIGDKFNRIESISVEAVK